MKKFLFILFLCTVSFSLFATKVLRGTALWVVDGDTVLLRQGNKLTSIRLWGIDAPESKQAGGKASTFFLAKLIGRKRVKIVSTGTGKYGRLIGKIYYKGKFINLEMVKAGHAWWHKKYSPNANKFKEAQKIAKKEKLGLWKNPFAIKPEFFRHPERQNISQVRLTANYSDSQVKKE
jgi:endonuclease YncB( thermonuclease family)